MALDESTLARVRSLILDEATRGWFELWPTVAARRAEFLRTAQRLTPEQAVWKPSRDAWSATEIVRHQLASSIGVLDIIHALSAGEAIRGGNYDDPGDVTAHEVSPDGEGDYSCLIEAFIEHSVRFTSIPLELPESPNMEAMFPHLYFGELNCRAWFAFQPIHDSDHFRGLTALLEHDDFPS